MDELRCSLAENLDNAADMDTVLNEKNVKLQNDIIAITKEKQNTIDKCNKLDQEVRTLKVNIIICIITEFYKTGDASDIFNRLVNI